MRKIILFIFTFLISIFNIDAQVGIGTTTPSTDLEVSGNTLIQKKLRTGALDFVQPEDEDFKMLTRLTNSNPVGKLAVLDVDNLQVAPVNVIDYKFTNIKLDNLRDVDLQYDADKYIVGISNFRYVGDGIPKTTLSNGNVSVGDFVTRVFIDNGTWHLEIRNRFLDLAKNDSLEYYVSLVIYDKSYYRNLPVITTNLNGSNTGTASQIPNLY